MKQKALYIRNRLSLRPPQEISLEILDTLCDTLDLRKSTDLQAALAKVKELYPACTDFERDFPSLCFALATGVGKTRLMGAFVTYLYLEKGIKNFLVLAPNLTIYQKLTNDFADPSNPKYVFKGMAEFAQKPPRVITGENYDGQVDLPYYADVAINIFNISKLNSETRGGKEPRIKRLAECLGESYFNYLSNLEDLVLLMDESHHYRADRGMTVINELKPILGLELTATPQVERNGKAIKFKNVVYEYSLAKAIRDGFVKKPAVATRKDFDPSHYSEEDLDRIKLEDGLRVHEGTKVALDIFARDNQARKVKPFVLVVAKDTNHAAKLMEMVKAKEFFDGYYADKVMEIHSNQTGSEKDENIERLLNLESNDNKIEVVVHVNMLKEGWDVTNLYTIIPLRTAASTTLREQTIGRGLRLPYGKTTGVEDVDKLTIIAHDRFQAIVDEANKPDSIIKKENIIELDPVELSKRKEAISAVSTIQVKLDAELESIAKIQEPEKRQEAENSHEVRKAIFQTLPTLNTTAKNIAELTSPEVKKIALARIKEEIIKSKPLFADDLVKEAAAQYETAVGEYTKNIIEIPKIIIMQSGDVRSGYRDFNLDTTSLALRPLSDDIVIMTLQDGKIQVITPEGGKYIWDNLANIIVNELINYPEVDYDSCSELLFKLVAQAIEKFNSYLTEEEVRNVVQGHKREIGRYIYSQLITHFYTESATFLKPKVYPFTKIEPHNFTKETLDKLHDFKETITPTSAIPGKVFIGFRKACHDKYKFDSKTEKDFAALLEQDSAVEKWLRPAQKQFNIMWNRNTTPYYPDFVVETASAIFLVETKKSADVGTKEVEEKTKAALTYCKSATEHTKENNGKPWRYLLIPHNEVLLNMAFDTLAQRFEIKEK